MVVLHARNAYKLGGAELYYASLLPELKKHKIHSVMVTQQPELAKIMQDLEFTVEQVPWAENSAGRKYLWIGPRTVLRYMYLIARYRVSIVNLSGRDAQVYGTIAAKLLGRKAVWTDHGDLKHVLEFTLRWQTKLLKVMTRHVDHAIFVSKAERDVAIKNFPHLASRSSVIYNGVKGRLFSGTRSPSAHPMVFSTARIQYEKGFVDLIEAMVLVKKQIKGVRLIVAAGVDDESLLVQARQKLKGSFEFLGFMPPEQISKSLSECWVFAFPSHSEAFSLSICEAMHKGTAIVATNVGGIPELIQDGETGLLVAPKQPEALAGALVNLLSNESQRVTLGRQAQAKARQQFDLERMVKDKIVALYNKLV